VSVKLQFQRQPNLSGDPERATQGFGRVSRAPVPAFDPAGDIDAASAFFERYGYVVLAKCLDAREVAHLNEFFERSQRERPDAWGLGERRKPHHTNQGLIFSQPLLDYPELDPYTRHPRSYPVVAKLLGGEEHARFS
jgi:hypothetical protein